MKLAENLKSLDEILAVLPSKQNENLYTETPSFFLQIMQNAGTLIQSSLYVGIVEDVIPVYQKYQHKLQEDPLLCLVEQLERGPLTHMVQHSEKLFDLIKVLLCLDSPSNTSRSRCMRILITRASEGRLENIQKMPAFSWDLYLIHVLKLLVQNGADPSWSSEDFKGASNLHLLLKIIPRILPCTSQILKKLLELLHMMVSAESDDYRHTIDSFGKTALHYLVESMCNLTEWSSLNQLVKLIKFLKERKLMLFNCNALSQKTALHCFLEGILKNLDNEHNYNILKFANEIVAILKTETNVNTQYDDGTTLLHVLMKEFSPNFTKEAKKLYYDLLNGLKSASNINSQDLDGKTALHYWVQSANKWVNDPDLYYKIVQILISLQNMITQDHKGNTPLHYFVSAASWFHRNSGKFTKLIEYLSYNVLNKKTSQGQTPLHLFMLQAVKIAAHAKVCLEIVNALKTPVNIDFTDRKGRTALHLFACLGSCWNDTSPFLDVIKCLSTSNNIDIQDYKGYTPLHLSMKVGDRAHSLMKDKENYLQFVKYLVSLKNVALKDEHGKTVLHYLANDGSAETDLQEYFENNLDSVISSECVPDEQKPIHKAKLILEVAKSLSTPYNKNVKDNKDRTPLHCYIAGALHFLKNAEAAECFHDTVKLLTTSTNIDIQDEDGDTPLHILVNIDSVSQIPVKVFLKTMKCVRSSQNVRMKNKGGQTALHILAEYEDNWLSHCDTFTSIVKSLSNSCNTGVELKYENGDRVSCLECCVPVRRPSKKDQHQHKSPYIIPLNVLDSPHNSTSSIDHNEPTPYPQHSIDLHTPHSPHPSTSSSVHPKPTSYPEQSIGPNEYQSPHTSISAIAYNKPNSHRKHSTNSSEPYSYQSDIQLSEYERLKYEHQNRKVRYYIPSHILQKRIPAEHYEGISSQHSISLDDLYTGRSLNRPNHYIYRNKISDEILEGKPSEEHKKINSSNNLHEMTYGIRKSKSTDNVYSGINRETYV